MAHRTQKVGEEKRVIIDEKVTKLFHTGQHGIGEESSEHVAHVYGRYNLNVTCPKDTYPLPDIDRLIDGSLSYHILSFMDTYF